MRLLIITQRVDIDDDNLGFFHRWLEKLAGKADQLLVVCLVEGNHRLPQNATVYSLGKERGYSKLRQFFRLQKFLLKSLPETDGVFVHMSPIYAIVSWPLAKIFRKKLALWYAHGSVSFKLKLAEKLVDAILTSSSAGCRLKSKKARIIGQGIDIILFQPQKKQGSEYFRILYAGRINKTKDPEIIIKAADILINQSNIKNIKLKIIGHPLIESERKYLHSLNALIKNKNLEECVEFVDGVPYAQMPEQYNEADLFVNPSSTGSLDKVVLEAMASGCLVLNCNEAYQDILAPKYLFKRGDAADLAQKIIDLMKAEKDSGLREIVVKNHDLENLIDKIISEFKL